MVRPQSTINTPVSFTCKPIRPVFAHAARKTNRILRIAPRYLRNVVLILFHKALYRFYLLRKRLLLPLYIRRTRLSLLKAERYLVAKHGRDWRLCVFDDQVVQFLKVRDDIHKRAWWPNDELSDGPSKTK